MSPLKRKLYLFSFVLMFLVTAPLLVLFTNGYRLDQQHRIVVHSGSITIKSWPRDINVYLNNKKYTKKQLNVINNSYTLNGLRPGRYFLRCEKPGYTEWSKIIDVHSGISTEFWNVILFPLDPEKKQYAVSQIQQFFLSPRDNNEVVFFTEQASQHQVYLLNTKENISQKVYETDQLSFISPDLAENVEWSSDNKSLLIPFLDKQEEHEYVIARIKKETLNNPFQITQRFPFLKRKIKKIRWMFDKNNELVALTTDHRLFYLKLESPQQPLLLAQDVSGFDFAGNRIYYSQLPNNFVWEIQDNDISTKRQITNQAFNSSSDFLELTVYDQYRIALRDKNGSLFFYNQEKEKGELSAEKISDNVLGVQFSDDGKKLLYWTPSEIWYLMLRDWKVQPLRKKGEKKLITRFSQPVKNVQWMDNYENIIFSVNNTIRSAEADWRDQVNIVTLLTTKNKMEKRDVLYNKNNQMLFYKFGDKKTLGSVLLINKKGFLGF